MATPPFDVPSTQVRAIWVSVVRAALLLKTGASGTPAHRIVAIVDGRLEPTALRAVTLKL